jgi:hypothetical protein
MKLKYFFTILESNNFYNFIVSDQHIGYILPKTALVLKEYPDVFLIDKNKFEALIIFVLLFKFINIKLLYKLNSKSNV